MSERAESENDSLHPVVRFLGMTSLGPITFIGALQADVHPPRDQLLAGLLGTFLWFRATLEVVAYV